MTSLEKIEKGLRAILEGIEEMRSGEPPKKRVRATKREPMVPSELDRARMRAKFAQLGVKL